MSAVVLENGHSDQPSRKIGDIVQQALKSLEGSSDDASPGFQYSFEYFPPKTAKGMSSLSIIQPNPSGLLDLYEELEPSDCSPRSLRNSLSHGCWLPERNSSAL